MVVSEPSSILIVDDEAPVAKSYARLLQRRGHQVTTASSAGEAIGLMAGAPFDVVVSDVMMPGDDGITMLRAAHVFDADLPVILMTGAPSVESAVQAVDSGAIRYLMKPVVDGRLEAAVDQAIAQFRLAKRRRAALAHSDEAERETEARHQLGCGFEFALERLWMAYQPIVSWSRRDCFAFEALLRTDDPAFPNPGVLLAAAERLGELDMLGRAIRGSVASRLASAPPGLLAFVNLHPADLCDQELYSPAAPLSGFAHQVVLEITERASIDQIEGLPARIAALRDMGFRIAIDDLGCGYSGLSSLVQLRPDLVKLDMSLVRGIDAEPAKQKLVASLVGVCRELQILVVAEGVETAAEREVLVGLGCDLLQGYLFARPQRELAEAPLPALCAA